MLLLLLLYISIIHSACKGTLQCVIHRLSYTQSVSFLFVLLSRYLTAARSIFYVFFLLASFFSLASMGVRMLCGCDAPIFVLSQAMVLKKKKDGAFISSHASYLTHHSIK